ncbi:MAG TPA: efflux RND transporter permease subunit, partial [Thermaerobacter sp.]
PRPVLAGAVPVRLTDVATVHLRRDPPPEVERLNGRDGLGLVVYQEPGANTVSVSRAVRAALDAGLESMPGWEATVTYDAGRLVEQAVRGVGQSLLVGSLLAVAVLWLFLRRGRTVAVIALAIPISACATLAAMHLLGMTLNVMSLGGLALSAGVLIDQAIVVLESIARRHQEGLPARQAADRGTAEVAAAVAASTVTNLIVFLPVLFLGGLAGQLFRDLALANGLAQAASLLVAVTVVPALAAWCLDEPATATGRAARSADSAAGSDRPDPGAVRLPRPVEACLARPAATLAVALVVVLASLPVAARLGTEFLPAVDEGAVDVTVILPEGSALALTAAALERVERVVLGIPGVETVIARAGGDPWAGEEGSTHQGLVRVQLADDAGSSAQVAERIRRVLAKEAKAALDRVGAQVHVQPRNLWADVGAGAPVVELVLRAPDPVTLAEAAARARRALAAVPGLVDVAVDLDRTAPRLAVRVDAAAAARFGLAPAQVGQQLRLALAGETVARARVEGRWLPVVLRTDAGTGAGGAARSGAGAGAASSADAGSASSSGAGDRAQPAGGGALAQVPLAGGSGWTRLDRVAALRSDATPAALVRRDGWLAATLTARPAGTDLGTAVEWARRQVAAVLPPGAAVEPAGTAVLMQEGFATLVPAAGGALLLIYMAMAAQFESLVHPLLMMVTLPLALVGAVGGLAAVGHAIGLTAVMGGIVLAGIAVNNGIVLVDAARRHRAAGMPPPEAIRLAWRRRLRPVLMTALTTLLGSLPMVLAPGRGGELEVPLAAVLVGGLFTSTALTLVVLPCAWLLAEGRRDSEGRRGNPPPANGP